VEIAGRYGAWLFCDEMYRGLELDGREPLPSAVNLYERCLVLSGLSKVYGLPGLRLGWLVTQDAGAMQSLIDWKYYTSICSPGPSEFLGLAALQAKEPIIARNRALVANNLALADSFFRRWPDRFTWRRPQAGPVALVGVGSSSAAGFCDRLAQQAGVLLLPGRYLDYDDHHLRMGFGRANFGVGLARLESFLAAGEGPDDRRESSGLTAA
jgi:aspartate/methionine/tyrosine aminotransferase